MSIKKTLLAAVLATAALPAAANAQPLPDADPALWVVKDEDTTIYMFGTFHLLDGKRDWFNDEVKTAFDASSEVVLEAVMPDDPAELQPLIMKYAVDPQGKTLSQKLSPEVKAKLDRTLGAAGLPAGMIDPLEPWFVSMTLTSLGAQKLGLKPEFGPDAILAKAARSARKKVGELEGMEQQLQIFDEMPEAAQIAAMGQTLDEMSRLSETLIPMLDAWSSGDTEGLVRVMNDGIEKQAELYRAIFVDRNAKWADWVSARLQQPGTIFMAVGAGHLAGKDSVQQHLAKKGISAKRVKS